MALASHACSVIRENRTVYLRENLQKTNCDERLQSLFKANFANCWVACLFWQNSHWELLKDYLKKSNQNTDTWIEWYNSMFAVEQRYSVQLFFPIAPSLSTATEDIRFCNTVSPVTCSLGKVKFSSSLCGLSTSSEFWQFSVTSCIEFKSNNSTECCLQLSIGIEGTWCRKFIAFLVLTYNQKSSAATKFTVGWPPWSIRTCLRLNCSYWNGFCLYDAAKVEFAFIALAIRRTGAFFSWMSWFCLAEKLKVFAGVSLRLNSTGVYTNKSFFLVISILQSNMKSLKPEINNPKNTVVVATDHVKFRFCADLA